MPGRGRVLVGFKGRGEELRRPGHPDGSNLTHPSHLTPSNEKCSDESSLGGGEKERRQRELLERIFAIRSPDDLEVQEVAMEIKTNIIQQDQLEWLVEEVCKQALNDRTFTPVAARVLGLVAHHHAGSTKILSLLMSHLQAQFEKKDDLVATDRCRFVTSALFLGEAYHHVKTEKDCPYSVLVNPVLTYLDMIIKPHIQNPQQEDNLDEEMLVVAKLLLQNGLSLHEVKASAIQSLVQGVTEVLCCRELRVGTRLNLLAALADLWPCLATTNVNMRIQHASLAAKLGVCLNV